MRNTTLFSSPGKRLGATAAAGLLILTLGACSSSDEKADKSDDSTTTKADTKSDDATTTKPTDKSDGSTGTTKTTDKSDGSTGTTGSASTAEMWMTTPTEHEGEIGETFDYECPPDGSVFSVWGAGVYSSDSSVCSAAVQVGLITIAEGGDVTVEIAAGEESYQAWTNNGVTSVDYGSWSGSFVFPEALPDTLDIP